MGDAHVVISSADTPGPDHAAEVPSLTERLYARYLYVRKAVVAFLIGGGGAAIADNLRQLDFSQWTWTQLVQGLVAGALSGIVVYFTSNRTPPS